MSNRHIYAQRVYDRAAQVGWTPAQVAGATYAQVCQAAQVDPAAPPADFFYVAVQRHVALRMTEEQEAARMEQRRLAIRAKVRELVEMTGAEIERTEDGFLVRLP